jgi:hypothetical protein
LQTDVLRLQRGDTRTQFFNFFEQRGVGHTYLTAVKLFCSINITVFLKNLFTAYTSPFWPALPARELGH